MKEALPASSPISAHGDFSQISFTASHPSFWVYNPIPGWNRLQDWTLLFKEKRIWFLRAVWSLQQNRVEGIEFPELCGSTQAEPRLLATSPLKGHLCFSCWPRAHESLSPLSMVQSSLWCYTSYRSGSGGSVMVCTPHFMWHWVASLLKIPFCPCLLLCLQIDGHQRFFYCLHSCTDVLGYHLADIHSMYHFQVGFFHFRISI